MDTSLEEDYEALVQFMYMAPIGLMQARLDGEILMVNPLCAQLLLPLSRDGSLSNLFTALQAVAPDLRQRVAGFGSDHGMVCDGMPLRLTLNPADRRSVRYLSLSLLKLDPGRVMAVLADVTQATLRDRELRHSQAWMSTIVTGLTDYALMTLDDRGCLRDWNASVERVTGYTRAAAVGQPCSLFHAPDAITPQRLQDRLLEADRCGWSLEEGWLQRVDGSRFWGSCLIAPLHAPLDALPEDRAFSLILRDVSHQREATEALRRTVACDLLTGVANRRAFFDAAEVELQRWRRTPRPLSLLIVEADRFSRLRECQGQAVGDAVLRHLAAGLSATFRSMDLVARLGDETFVVLLPGATSDNAADAALRLGQRIASQTVQVGGDAVHYALSAGLATMEQGVQDVDALVARAQQALRAAQRHGRRRVVVWAPGLQATEAPLNAV